VPARAVGARAGVFGGIAADARPFPGPGGTEGPGRDARDLTWIMNAFLPPRPSGKRRDSESE